MAYEVLVAPPNDIAILEGLKQGIYKITGGVIRDVDGGKIVAHMREVGILPKPSLLSSLGPLMPYLNLGVGVLTLSVVALSTYHLSRKISELSERLDRVFEELKKIRQDVELIKAIEIFKDLKSALLFSEDMIKDSRLRWELLVERLKTLRRAAAVYDTYIDYAFAKLFDGYNPEVISEPLKLYMLAYAGYSSLLFELNELDQAEFEYQRAYDRVKEIYSNLVEDTKPIQDKLREIELLKVDVERFWGYKKEIETVKSLGMSSQEWKSLTDGKSDGVYLIKVSK